MKHETVYNSLHKYHHYWIGMGEVYVKGVDDKGKVLLHVIC